MRRIKRKKPASNLIQYLPWLGAGIVLIVGIAVAFSQPKPDVPASAEMPMIPLPEPTPKTDTFEQISADGTITAHVHTEQIDDDQLRYTVSVSTPEKPELREVFRETVSNTIEIKLPFNSWSPDNKLFLVEKYQPTSSIASEVMVLKASGENFGEQKYLEIRRAFIDKELPYQFSEATGWASPTLVLVRTMQEDGVTRGPAYWFEVPSQRFIQLYTRF